jgi:hypothetical protein
MAVKLHVCANTWVKIDGHPCWRVRKALDEAGVEYTVVKGPAMRSKRADNERLSGQRLYPVIEFEDGSVYREQSKDMAARIRAGRLMEARGTEGVGPEEPGHFHSEDSAEPGAEPAG